MASVSAEICFQRRGGFCAGSHARAGLGRLLLQAQELCVLGSAPHYDQATMPCDRGRRGRPDLLGGLFLAGEEALLQPEGQCVLGIRQGGRGLCLRFCTERISLRERTPAMLHWVPAPSVVNVSFPVLDGGVDGGGVPVLDGASEAVIPGRG